MKTLPTLFENNRRWAKESIEKRPDFFEHLAEMQRPSYLWIGCSDSRVPATEICGLDPGSMFVHRNVANLVVHTDFSMLSVLQYAVEVLEVKHVIVCGHYGCGGVKAALGSEPHGLIDNWLRHIKDVAHMFREELGELEDGKPTEDRMCEVNVAAQVANLCHTTVVQNAWTKGRELSIHGWIYRIQDGLLRDLGLCVQRAEQLPDIYRMG